MMIAEFIKALSRTLKPIIFFDRSWVVRCKIVNKSPSPYAPFSSLHGTMKILCAE